MDAGPDNDLVQRAVAGDRAAFEALLAVFYPRLRAHFAPLLPRDLQGVLSVEDVLQDGILEACQTLGTVRIANSKALYAWLLTVVEHNMFDLLRAARTAKRNRGWSPLDAESTSVAGTLEQWAVNLRTPSSSAAGHEASVAVRTALDLLPAGYRDVLRLRYFEGVSVAEAAVRLGRSEAAVQMLCHRGLRQLAVLMGSASRFLSAGA